MMLRGGNVGLEVGMSDTGALEAVYGCQVALEKSLGELAEVVP